MKIKIIPLILLYSSCVFSEFSDGTLITSKKINQNALGVGDIKYSMLRESTFQSRFGNCWILLDGEYSGENIADSTYGQITGQSTLPDFSGRFLRNVGGNAPSLGETQEDAFQGHGHRLEGSFSGDGKSDSSNNRKMMRDGDVITTYEDDAYVKVPLELSGYGVPRYDVETRPKSLAVNMFLKINEECQ